MFSKKFLEKKHLLAKNNLLCLILYRRLYFKIVAMDTIVTTIETEYNVLVVVLLKTFFLIFKKRR